MAEGSAITSVGGFTIKASTGTASNGITTTIYVVSRNGVQGFANDPSGIYAAAQSVQQRSFGGVVEDVNDWVASGGAQALARQSEAQASAAPVTTAPEKFGEQVDTAKTTEPPPEQINESDDDNQDDNIDDDGISPYGEEDEPLEPSANNNVSGGETADRTGTGASNPTSTAAQVNQSTVQPASAGNSGANPNFRQDNPLGDFSSYTYNLSLYMLSAEAYNQLAQQGYQQLAQAAPQGVYLIAQSGGVNNAGPIKKAPQFANADFFIEDLKIKTLTASAMSTSLNTFEYSFKIVEPMSFSFLERLKQLAIFVQSNSALQKTQKTPINPLQAQYLLAIRFYGYDKNGAVVTGSQYSGSNSAASNSSALFERYYPIYVTDLKFSIGAGPTTYDIKAQLYDTQRGVGTKTATVPRTVNLVAGTVREAIEGEGTDVQGLLEDINQYEQTLVTQKKKKIANSYKVEFDQSSDIADSKFEQDDFKNTGAKKNPDTTQSNTVGASNRNVAANPTKKSINISQGVNVLQALDKILGQSNYVRDALKKKTLEKNEGGSEDNAAGKILDWYIINPRVKVLGWDEQLNDWAHEITYQIKTYRVPYIKSVYADRVSSYTGPHKFYEYIFTGKNREIISYEQRFNTLYYINATNVPENTGGQPLYPNPYQSTPVALAATTGEDNSSSRRNAGNEAENSFKISLYSPGDQARARLEILGDPDYLDQSLGSIGSGPNMPTGADNSINFNWSQVFIEIVFATADDYSLNNGTLAPQNNIIFWEYPPEVKHKGIIYMVVTVTSEFIRGSFKQILDLQVVQLPGNNGAAPNTANNDTEDRPVPAPAPTTGDRSSYASDTGAQDPSTLTSLKQISASISDTGAQDPSQFQRSVTDSFGLSQLVPSPAGGTQDDDAVGAGDYDDYNEGREVLGP